MKLTENEKERIRHFLNEKNLPQNHAVTYSDVTLPDLYSDVRSRSNIKDFSTSLTEDIELGIPLISANMESVSGADMIVAMERNGGLGIPFQGLPLRERLDILERVRRADCTLIHDPVTVPRNTKLNNARDRMEEYGIGCLIVVNDSNHPVGILSKRDWFYEPDQSRPIEELMSEDPFTIPMKDALDFESMRNLIREKKIEKLPVVDEDGTLAGLITARGLFYERHHPRAMRDQHGQFLRIGSIGVGQTFRDDHLHALEQQVEAGITALLIDTARANSVNAQEVVEGVRESYPDLTLIAGNVSTPAGVKMLCSAGVDIVKVGVGPGHACTTRKTGVGVPQLTAVAKCAAIAEKFDASIIADGGVESAGDVAKALVAGADAIMAGFLFARTHEAAAREKKKYVEELDMEITVKAYRGSASIEAQRERKQRGDLDRTRRPEGIERHVPVVGSVDEVIEELLGGLRSCMSYLGVRTARELQKKGKFIMQTGAGHAEGVDVHS